MWASVPICLWKSALEKEPLGLSKREGTLCPGSGLPPPHLITSLIISSCIWFAGWQLHKGGNPSHPHQMSTLPYSMEEPIATAGCLDYCRVHNKIPCSIIVDHSLLTLCGVQSQLTWIWHNCSKLEWCNQGGFTLQTLSNNEKNVATLLRTNSKMQLMIDQGYCTW